MDFSMPVMNGFECAEKIRELEKQWKEEDVNPLYEASYIIGLSAHSND
jgi:CheY-like chemotaxis protein